MIDDKLAQHLKFKKIFDDKVQFEWHKTKELIKGCNVSIHRYDFSVELDADTLKEFGLNKDIVLVISVTSDGGKAIYYYQGVEIEPDCYYMRPDDYHQVTTLQMLQEAIRQDTYKPDIKYLENGEKQIS